MSINIKNTVKRTSQYKNVIVSCNVHSFNQNFFPLNELVQKVRPSIICLSEMWAPHNPVIKGYKSPVMVLRKNKSGGGVATFLSNETSYSRLPNIDHIPTQILEKVAIKLDKQGIVVITIYRPPKSNVTISLLELETILAEANKTNFLQTIRT